MPHEVLTLYYLIDWLGAPLHNDVEGVSELERVVDVCDIRMSQEHQFLEFCDRVVANEFVCAPWLQYLHGEFVIPSVGAFVDDTKVAISQMWANAISVFLSTHWWCSHPRQGAWTLGVTTVDSVREPHPELGLGSQSVDLRCSCELSTPSVLTNLLTGAAPLMRVPSPTTDHGAVSGAALS